MAGHGNMPCLVFPGSPGRFRQEEEEKKKGKVRFLEQEMKQMDMAPEESLEQMVQEGVEERYTCFFQ